MGRRTRAQTQRILLVKVESDDEKIEYSILGTTGTIYTVKQCPKARRYFDCSCPDSKMRRVDCKHIYFVQDRVLKGDLNFVKAKERLEKVDIEAALWSTAEPAIVEQREWIGQDCAICIEEMSEQEPVYWCRTSCGQSVHDSCWKRWCQVRGPTCVYCRKSSY